MPERALADEGYDDQAIVLIDMSPSSKQIADGSGNISTNQTASRAAPQRYIMLPSSQI